MMRRSLVLGLLMGLLLARQASASDWVYADPGQFFKAQGINVTGFAGSDGGIDQWCEASDGCYPSDPYTQVSVSGSDGYYSYAFNWGSAGSTFNVDSTPGATMQPTTYYVDGDITWELWYCYPEYGCFPGGSYTEWAGYGQMTVSPYVYTLNVSVNAFIPEAVTWHPLFPPIQFAGDNRGFDASGNGSSRIYGRAITFWPPSSATLAFESHDTGWTHLVAPIDSWRKAPADGIQCYMAITETFSLTIVCNGHGVNPFVEFLPEYSTSIDYNFDLRFVFQDYGQLGCMVEYHHQGFPDYEAHVSGMRLWEYDHGGYDADALGGSLEIASPQFNFVQLF